jgi:pyruvate dehydrogenase E1 component
VTSWGELNRDGVYVETQKLRHPDRPAGVPYVAQALAGVSGPVIAVSDWMRAVPEQIRPWVPGTYITLGTDGFGFSDTRPAARRYFNTDAESVTVAVLEGLARDGNIDQSVAVEAARKYQVDDVMAAPEQTSDPGVA